MENKYNIKVQLYTYRATITEVYDGDTFTADINLGMGVHMHGVKIRLSYVDTPEIRGEERPRGLEVRDHVRELILGKEVVIQTQQDKTGKYGRLLADVYIDEETPLSNYLVENFMAEWWE
jgi:micrococcal nuclease